MFKHVRLHCRGMRPPQLPSSSPGAAYLKAVHAETSSAAAPHAAASPLPSFRHDTELRPGRFGTSVDRSLPCSSPLYNRVYPPHWAGGTPAQVGQSEPLGFLPGLAMERGGIGGGFGGQRGAQGLQGLPLDELRFEVSPVAGGWTALSPSADVDLEFGEFEVKHLLLYQLTPDLLLR